MHRTHQLPGSILHCLLKASRKVTRRSRRLAAPRPGGMMSPAGWLVHLFVALALGAGLLLPLTDVGQALANPGLVAERSQARAQDASPGAPSQVIAFGDFQDQLGCSDGDTFCQSSSLSDVGGIWSGVFPLTAGSYSVQFAVTDQSGNQYVLGSGGLDGAPVDFSVGDSQTGAYFSYDSHTNDIRAEGVDALYTVQTDLGVLLAAPSGGDLAILIPSQGGTVNVQLLANGTPVAEPQQASLSPGWTRVTLDTSGNVLEAEGLTYGTLTVVRLDADGNVATGACYQLESGGLVNQGCDSDDGSLDGSTPMTFPNGLEPGGYTLIEVQPPDGSDPLDDQQVDLQAGDNVVQAQQPADDGELPIGDEPADEPGDDIIDEITGEATEEVGPGELPIDATEDVDRGPGDLIVALFDDSGNPIGGACWQLLLDGAVVAESCDATDAIPLNGVVGFFGVPGGTYTLQQSETPEGSNPVDDQDVEVIAGAEERVEIVAPVTESEEETVVPAEDLGDETGDVVVLRQDLDGSSVGGSCFEILDGLGGVVAGEVCDEDGDVADDGRTGFSEVPAGDWIIRETRPPDDYETAPDSEVTVVPGEEVDVPIQSAAVAVDEPTEELVDVATGTPDDQPTEEPAETATGYFQVDLSDPNGNLIGGACWQLIQDGNAVDEACDTEEAEDNFPLNGKVGFYDVPVGVYTLRISSVPGGFEAVADQSIDVAEGDALLEVTIQPSDAATEEPVETEEPTEAPAETEEPTEAPVETEEPTEEPVVTEESTVTDLGDPGSLIVTLQDAEGANVGGACFELLNGDDLVASSCDTDDDFPDNGRTGFFGVPSGAFLLQQSIAQPGTDPIEPIEVEVVAGATTEIVVNAPASAIESTEEPEETEEPSGQSAIRVDVSSIEQSSEPICIELNTTGGIGLVNPPAACDNGEGDGDGTSGIILIENVPPGEYSFFVTAGPPDAVNQQFPLVTINEDAITEVQIEEEAPPEEPTAEPTEVPEPTAEPTEVPELGAIDVEIVDQDGNLIEAEGACLTIDGLTASVCDNQPGDEDSNPGVLLFEDVPAGIYSVTQDAAPAGFEVGEGLVDVQVEEGQVADEALNLAATTGTIQIIAADGSGNPIGGACWSLTSVASGNFDQCDDETNGGIADDGFATFADVPAGEYTLSQFETPPGYAGYEDDATITVESGDNEPVSVSHVALSGSISSDITSGGEPLAGACLGIVDVVTVCDNGDGDQNPDEGAIQIDGVPPGTYTAAVSNYPAELEDPGSQDVTVVSEETTTVDFDLVPATGSVVAVVSSSGEPVGGACVGLIDAVTVCDNEDGDQDPDEGTIQIDGIAPGPYTAALSNYPAEYEDPGFQEAVVVAGETDEIAFDLALAPPQTADFQIMVQTAGAEPVVNGCVALSQENTVVYGPICDNQTGDSDPDDSSILFVDVEVGSYVASLTPDSTANIEGFQSADSPSVTVEAGIDNQGVITVVIEESPTTGALELITRNNANNSRVGGACYELDGAGDPITVCDNDANDLNALIGVIQLADVPTGDYDLVMSTTPDGFNEASLRTITVDPGVANSYEIRIDPLPQESTLIVYKEDPDGAALGNSCFALRQGGATIASRCDSIDSNPNDGALEFAGLDAGTYTVVETKAPTNGYSLAAPVSVTIVAGVDRDVTVINYPKPGRLVVTKVDAGDASVRLENACFALEGDRNYGPYCDGDDGLTDGRIVFANVVAGNFTIVETSPPAGYLPAGDRDVTINPGASVNVAIANEQTPLPPETGDLVVTKVDSDEDLLPGSCFRLFDGNIPISAQVCDSADGVNDGLVRFGDVATGTWTLRETVTPSPSYQYAQLVDVEILDDQTTEATIENRLKPGRLQVNKTNEDGQVLQGACFDLEGDGAGARCTNSSGVLNFSDLEPGTYTLVETQAPYGYERSADIQNVQVLPGQTRVVHVVDERTPPPADTGSVQIQKFYCPAGEGGERTQFFGGAQGTQQLARTAGCEKGNAVFTMTAEGGEGGPGEFQTGTDGQHQVTIPEGLFRLTETDPDLEGNSSVLVRINRGQMTTVIVINYLEPPEPEAATIEIAKYTCAPSFNGTLYEDFAGGCSESAQLTNNITIRIEGAVTAKAATGDGGARGVTSFEDLTPGSYTIYEDRPYNTPTDYLFCGFNPDLPADWKAVNGTLTVKVDYGQTLTCEFFNIPELLTPDTGTILVRKYVCEVDQPPKGYDWETECRLSNQSASFSLALFNAETEGYEEPSMARANPDGLLRFTHLGPGSYQLREVDGVWCHAESNSVDSKGDVVVAANTLAEVWIYNCVDTQEPPNTGSGDAATNPPPATDSDSAPVDGPTALPGIAVPLLATAAWLTGRRGSIDRWDRAA